MVQKELIGNYKIVKRKRRNESSLVCTENEYIASKTRTIEGKIKIKVKGKGEGEVEEERRSKGRQRAERWLKVGFKIKWGK